MIIPHNEEELLEVQKEGERQQPQQEKIEEIFNKFSSESKRT